MKSMLCEASSVIKAIEEAWDKSGKPVEFTIKILEQGKKGFLWFGNEPTIISLAYEPKRQPNRPSEKPKHTNNNQPNNNQPDRRKQQPNQYPNQQAQQQTNQQPQRAQQQPAVKSQPVKTQSYQKPVQQKELPVQNNKPLEPKVQAPKENKENKENINHWNQDFVQNISQNLDELCGILGIKTPYSIRTDNRKLHILFESRLLGASDEKMLFISLSYLLMQFVKKRFKKKFRGFHLILKSKDSAAHDDGQAPSE